MKKITIILLSALSAGLIVACGAGDTTNGNTYYSASNTSHYVIESGINPQNESQLYLSMITRTSTWQVPLTPVTTSVSGTNSYTYNQNNTFVTVTLREGIFGISYKSTTENWIDIASIESHVASSIPNGSYNLLCDQANLSPCTMVVESDALTGNQVVSVTEFNSYGNPNVLCDGSPIIQVGQSNPINTYLYSFTCSNAGGTSSGTWDVLPFTKHGRTALMVAENNYSSNITDDSTDEIAFSQNGISPNGNYNYLYNQSGGVGVTVASFTGGALLNNSISGCSACGLTLNQYYNANAATGFAWYSSSSLFGANYNVTGDDIIKMYQDSVMGFYL